MSVEDLKNRNEAPTKTNSHDSTTQIFYSPMAHQRPAATINSRRNRTTPPFVVVVAVVAGTT